MIYDIKINQNTKYIVQSLPSQNVLSVSVEMYPHRVFQLYITIGVYFKQSVLAAPL